MVSGQVEIHCCSSGDLYIIRAIKAEGWMRSPREKKTSQTMLLKSQRNGFITHGF